MPCDWNATLFRYTSCLAESAKTAGHLCSFCAGNFTALNSTAFECGEAKGHAFLDFAEGWDEACGSGGGDLPGHGVIGHGGDDGGFPVGWLVVAGLLALVALIGFALRHRSVKFAHMRDSLYQQSRGLMDNWGYTAENEVDTEWRVPGGTSSGIALSLQGTTGNSAARVRARSPERVSPTRSPRAAADEDESHAVAASAAMLQLGAYNQL
jgi:hypothetical protein